jgi:hypothetical protein
LTRRKLPSIGQDPKESTVAVHHNEASGYYTTSIPKPAIVHLGKGKEVEAVEYAIRGSRVELRLPVED